MKRLISALLILVLLLSSLAALTSALAEAPAEAPAESPEEKLVRLRREKESEIHVAKSVDRQLSLLDAYALEYEQELAADDAAWFGFNIRAAEDLPVSLVAPDWESAYLWEFDQLLPSMRGRKFVAFIISEDKSVLLPGDIMTRLPAEMRATSLKEAEYALLIRHVRVKSGYNYNLPVTSYHLDHEAYVLRLEDGILTRFWSYRSEAKRSGMSNELSGKPLTSMELWQRLRPILLGK